MFHATFKTAFGKFSLFVYYTNTNTLLIEIAIFQMGKPKILYSREINSL